MSERLPENVKLSSDIIFSPTLLVRVVADWLLDQGPLVEALCLALSLHVLLFPLLWSMGLILPFPKSPVVTTVIELDLSNWPVEARPDKVIDIRDPELNH